MKKLKHITAITLSKLASMSSQILNMGAGTSLPGKIALRVSPTVLKDLVNQTQKEKIFVTGTNGKTTTSGLIASILEADGRTLAHNRKGANMLNGLTTAITQKASLLGKLNVDNCLLEIDEAYFPLVTTQISPNIVAITNLFRDQLDRYGELDTTAKKVIEGIEKIKDTEGFCLITNADDPMTTSIAQNLDLTTIYYGIEGITYNAVENKVEAQSEIVNCSCGNAYKYLKKIYSHIGHYYCDCGIKRPIPDVIATKVEINVSSSDISLITPQGSFSFTLHLPGLYNVYNALCAVSMAVAMDIPRESIVNGIENYTTVFGRSEKVSINGKEVLIQLIKNPVGATEVLKTVSNDPHGRLIIGINDNYADGRDVSWLWDAEFEILKDHQKEIICTGVRASDMAVRLKYAGIERSNIKVIEDIRSAIETLTQEIADEERVYILPTYTVLLGMQHFMKSLTKN